MEKPGENSTKMKNITFSTRCLQNELSADKSVFSDLKIICICGKMASGKNYICSIFEKNGWSSVDADLLVHSAIENASDKIKEVFSDEAKKNNIIITNEDGSINRRRLGQLLFKNPELLRKQEEIVYPLIEKMIEDYIQNHEKTIINATVLYKTPELLSKCEVIVFVKAGFFKRLIRTRKRDKLSFTQILRRYKSQRNLFSNYKQTAKKIIIIKN